MSGCRGNKLHVVSGVPHGFNLRTVGNSPIEEVGSYEWLGVRGFPTHKL